jgi:hypothetical protein
LLVQVMCIAAFVMGLVLIVFSLVGFGAGRRQSEPKISFKVFGQEFTGGMLGAFLVVGLVLTLFSVVQAKREESSVNQLASEADNLVEKAEAAGAPEHAATAWKETAEASKALHQELAVQNAKLPIFRSYARARSLAENVKGNAGSLQDVLRTRGVLTPSTPGSIQDQIRRVYHDVLDRAPEPWEVNVWVDNINSGRESIASMRTAFAQDPQCDTAVKSAYQGALHREPSPQELTSAKNQLSAGGSIATIKRRLVQG